VQLLHLFHTGYKSEASCHTIVDGFDILGENLHWGPCYCHVITLCNLFTPARVFLSPSKRTSRLKAFGIVMGAEQNSHHLRSVSDVARP